MPTKEPKAITQREVNMPFMERYIYGASQAQMVCDSAFLAHIKYHWSIYNMMEQFDGLYPHSPEYLEEAGLSWISNVPYRLGWSYVEKASTTRLNMLISAIYFCTICFRPFRKSDEEKPEYFFLTSPELKKNFENRLTKIFVDTLHRDPTFFRDVLTKLSYNQVTWGYSVSQWEDHSVFPEVPEILNVYFERANRIDNIKTYIYVFYQKTEDLYALYKREEKRGWETSFYIKEGLEESLQWALQRHEQRSYNSWSDIVRTYDEAQLWDSFAKCTDQMSWAWIWNEEVEGGVTKSLFAWNRGQTTMPAGSARFNLYANDNTMPNGTSLSYQRHYPDQKIEDIWMLFPNSGMTNTNVAQDLRGIASYAYELDVANNIKRNGVNDAVTMRLPLPVKAGFGQQMQQIRDINIMGGMSIWPNTFEPMRDVGGGSILRDAMEILALEKSEFHESTSQYNPQIAGKLTDRATDQQVQAISAETARQRSDFATVPVNAMRHLLKGIITRLSKDYEEDDKGYSSAQYFKDCVRDYLFPLTGQKDLKEPSFSEEDFLKALVDAVDYIALEYTSNDVPSLQSLIQLSQTPDGKRYYMRKLAMANGASYAELETYFPLQDSPDLNINDTSLALIENFMFWETGEVAYSALQSPVTHLQWHFTKAMELLQGVQNGMDPLTIWKWYSNMLPHAQKHLEQLSQDVYEQEAFESFSATFKQLNKVADELAAFAQKQAKDIAAAQQDQAAQQQQGGQLPPETQQKLAILQAQAQEKMRRTEEQSKFKAQMMEQRHQQNMQMTEQRHQQQMREQAERFQLEQIERQNKSQG